MKLSTFSYATLTWSLEKKLLDIIGFSGAWWCWAFFFWQTSHIFTNISTTLRGIPWYIDDIYSIIMLDCNACIAHWVVYKSILAIYFYFYIIVWTSLVNACIPFQMSFCNLHAEVHHSESAWWYCKNLRHR